MRYLLLAISFIFTLGVWSQMSSNFNTSRNWSMNKKEIFLAVGATQFLGDLGGRDQDGTQKSPIDIDWPATRYGVGLGYRYRFHPYFATSTQFYFGEVSGDDAHTEQVIRQSRNLSFKSPIIELSQRFEYIILANEKVGARYKIKRLKGMRSKADQLYLFSGVGGAWFNPKTQVNGNWVDLKPLRTEGQGLPGGPDEYSNFTATIPFGIGGKLGISPFWRIGFEISYHKTFTDYIDDVSGNYYDPEILAQEVGQNAAYASNPAIENHAWFAPGQQRGNPNDNDAYILANITIIRNVTYPKQKGGRVKWKGRTKF